MSAHSNNREFSLSASLWTPEQLAAVDHRLFDLLIIGNPFCLTDTYGAGSPVDKLNRALEIVAPFREKAVFALPVAPLQSELPLLDSMLPILEKAGVGGVEVQSHAMAWKVKRDFPAIPVYFGSFTNVHTTCCAKEMADLGALGGSLPFELDGEEQKEITHSAALHIYLPILGRFPVSFSQSCHFHLDETGFPFKCGHECRKETLVEFEGALTVLQKGRALFSDKALSLLGRIPEVADMGFSRFRIEGSLMDSVVLNGSGKIARLIMEKFFKEGIFSYGEWEDELAGLFPGGFCNGFFFGKRGVDYV